MSHGSANASVFFVRRVDGTAATATEVIVMRRGAFKWLPVLCSNDLVHGSWWFVWGSLGCALFAIIPLIQQYLTFYHQHDDVLPSIDFKLTWALLIFSGVFFTLGSLAFVRAFEETPKRALFYWNKHFQTDELLGAWLFLVGTVPAVPYTLVYFLIDPTFTYLGALSSSGVFVIGSLLFVLACYPSSDSTKKSKNYILPCFERTFGSQTWMYKHLATDWLAATWFIFWANLVYTFFSFLLLFIAIGVSGNPEQIFIWLSSAVSSFFFLIGSIYFVSGSYPHALQIKYIQGLSEDTATLVDTTHSSPMHPEHHASAPLLGDAEEGTSTAGGKDGGVVISPMHADASVLTSPAKNSKTPFGLRPVVSSSTLDKATAAVAGNGGKAESHLLVTEEDENREDDDDDDDDL